MFSLWICGESSESLKSRGAGEGRGGCGEIWRLRALGGHMGAKGAQMWRCSCGGLKKEWRFNQSERDNQRESLFIILDLSVGNRTELEGIEDGLEDFDTSRILSIVLSCSTEYSGDVFEVWIFFEEFMDVWIMWRNCLALISRKKIMKGKYRKLFRYYLALVFLVHKIPWNAFSGIWYAWFRFLKKLKSLYVLNKSLPLGEEKKIRSKLQVQI